MGLIFGGGGGFLMVFIIIQYSQGLFATVFSVMLNPAASLCPYEDLLVSNHQLPVAVWVDLPTCGSPGSPSDRLFRLGQNIRIASTDPGNYGLKQRWEATENGFLFNSDEPCSRKLRSARSRTMATSSLSRRQLIHYQPKRLRTQFQCLCLANLQPREISCQPLELTSRIAILTLPSFLKQHSGACDPSDVTQFLCVQNRRTQPSRIKPVLVRNSHIHRRPLPRRLGLPRNSPYRRSRHRRNSADSPEHGAERQRHRPAYDAKSCADDVPALGLIPDMAAH